MDESTNAARLKEASNRENVGLQNLKTEEGPETAPESEPNVKSKAKNARKQGSKPREKKKDEERSKLFLSKTRADDTLRLAKEKLEL